MTANGEVIPPPPPVKHGAVAGSESSATAKQPVVRTNGGVLTCPPSKERGPANLPADNTPKAGAHVQPKTGGEPPPPALTETAAVLPPATIETGVPRGRRPRAEAGTPSILLAETGGASQALCEFLAGGIDKVTDEKFKTDQFTEKLAAIQAVNDEAVRRGSQLLYPFGSKSKDSLVVMMRMAVGNSRHVTLDAPGGGDGGPSTTFTEKNHIGLALCSAVNWNQPDDVKSLMKQCSEEFLLRAFHLARKKVRNRPVARAAHRLAARSLPC